MLADLAPSADAEASTGETGYWLNGTNAFLNT